MLDRRSAFIEEKPKSRPGHEVNNVLSCLVFYLAIYMPFFLLSLVSLDIYNMSRSVRLTFRWLWQVSRCLSDLFYFPTDRLTTATLSLFSDV